MSATSQPSSRVTQPTGAQAVVESLLHHGIAAGFGIPSIHNIAIYEVLRRTPDFHHWVVRHEQAAGFAADGFFRASGRAAAVFASTGPGNLFTLVPLLESLQTNTPLLLIGTNVATPVLGKTCNALHETPRQLEILAPLTRYAVRISAADEIPAAMAAAITALQGPAPGPAFVEIPHDLLLAPVTTNVPVEVERTHAEDPATSAMAEALRHIEAAQRPVVLLGSGVSKDAAQSVVRLVETLQPPFITTTSGKGVIADDHPLSMGCISRLGAVQQLLGESDLLISIGARLTEFDTGRFGLKLPAAHIKIAEDVSYFAGIFPASFQMATSINAASLELAGKLKPRKPWWDTAGMRAREKQRLDALKADGYAALALLRSALSRNDIVAHDQSILNYWASAFFPVLEPRTFLYPFGSGTLGYGLPAAIGAACAMRRCGDKRKIVCVAGDGGFQYTSHELATL
ncbi:MAG TPA: thiamine pyrophosphate-binding protein, partial [Candidatus Angelobacter sp.]|nr:thiamine pyrophosphate-binding protein [Candidatus Angelobacter sp.]